MEDPHSDLIKIIEPSHGDSAPRKPSEIMQDKNWGKVKDISNSEMLFKHSKLFFGFWGELISNLISYSATSTVQAVSDVAQGAVTRISGSCTNSQTEARLPEAVIP
ncbi:hypothetical protein SK128_023828 [Halocaridina rubra]|uniref:Uncharacterized protein n=1 Tax=Halocaridina rubra TaxID=373956 RepID=A0AAN8XA06_HALRR